MLRVQKLKILCPVCGKPDGCLVSDDGAACICSRIEQDSVKKVGTGPFYGGWLHILGDFKPKKYTEPEKPYINWNSVAVNQGRQLNEHAREFAEFCRDTKINPIAALRFFVGWDDGWITIPIYGEDGKISGVQKRQGVFKRFIEHSSAGVFVPSAFFQYKCKTLAICEGWTDTVIATQYGFNALGKLNSHVGNEQLKYFIDRIGCDRIVIFADNNENNVGMEGAEATKDFFSYLSKPIKIVLTPHKDLKDCYTNGLTLRDLFGD